MTDKLTAGQLKQLIGIVHDAAVLCDNRDGDEGLLALGQELAAELHYTNKPDGIDWRVHVHAGRVRGRRP